MGAELPVLPGDLLLFHVSGNRMLVVVAEKPEDGKQDNGGLMSTTHRTCEVATMTLDWKGHTTFWTIHRLVE